MERFLALEDPSLPPRRAWGAAVLAGVLTAAQAWAYWFMGYFMAFLFLWLAGAAFLSGRGSRTLLARYAVAASLALLCVAPALGAMAGRMSQAAVPGLSASSTGIFELPGVIGNNVSPNLHGYWLMERWGAPMLGYGVWMGLILLAVVGGRQRGRWLGAMAWMLFLALGPTLPAAGWEVRNPIYLPLFHLLPYFDRLWFPYRMVGVAFLCLTLVAGTALDRLFLSLAGRLPRLSGPAPALAATLALLSGHLAEQSHGVMWPFITRDVEPPRIVEWIADKGGAVIHCPIGINQPAIIWQTLHHQPLFGGMGENAPVLWPKGYNLRIRTDFIEYLRRAVERPDRVRWPSSDIPRQRLVSEGFRWVVLHRDLVERVAMKSAGPEADDPSFFAERAAQAAILYRDLLGPPIAAEGPLLLWSLEPGASPIPGLEPTEESITTRTWGTTPPPLYEAWLESRGRFPKGGAPVRRDNSPGGGP